MLNIIINYFTQMSNKGYWCGNIVNCLFINIITYYVFLILDFFKFLKVNV